MKFHASKFYLNCEGYSVEKMEFKLEFPSCLMRRFMVIPYLLQNVVKPLNTHSHNVFLCLVKYSRCFPITLLNKVLSTFPLSSGKFLRYLKSKQKRKKKKENHEMKTKDRIKLK